MKVLGQSGLARLIQKMKATFLDKTDIETATILGKIQASQLNLFILLMLSTHKLEILYILNQEIHILPLGQ